MASISPKIDKVKRIDVHTHIMFPGEEGGKYAALMPRLARDEAGQEVIQVRGRSFRGQMELHNPKRRIQDMDKKGIDMQVLSIMPVFIFYDVDPELGIACSQIQNNAIAAIVKTYPDRFVGLATVPLQVPLAAAKELKRAMNELGMKGVQILSDVNEKNLDWPELWPFYETAQELGAFILCHPGAFSVMERMKKFHLQNLVGHPFDTSLAIASVIFGGVLRDFPKLKLCFLHGGGFAPYQRGRFEHGYQVRPECKERISKPPSEYFKLLHFDTVTHYDPALEYLIRTVGSDKVLMGSDYPADMADPDPVATLSRLEPIPSADKENIFGKNAARLLGL
jgi:aminocarboxymuconate-semialdehyde decarboxylase